MELRRTRIAAAALAAALVTTIGPVAPALASPVVDPTAAARAEVSDLLGRAVAGDLSSAAVVELAAAADPRADGSVAVAVERADGGLEIVQIAVDDSSERTAARLVAGSDVVVAAGPEVIVRPLEDPLRSAQWALDKLGQSAAATRSTGAGVTVAVVDTGVEGAHPDLAANLVTGASCYTGSCASPGGTTDLMGHGTHVAGIIGAVDGNGVGTAGLAPQVSIMPVDVFGASGGASGAAVAAGVVWATDNGADVINLSLGSPTADPVQQAAVRYALRHGVAVVGSAGNTGASAYQYPGSFPEVVSVAATTSSDTKASFSTFNDRVWIAAPGLGIRSTIPGGWGDKSGTSMAAPYVSAAMALLLEDRPQLTPAQLRHLLRLTALDLGTAGRDPQFGWGRIRPVNALDLATPAVNGTVAFPLATSLAGNVTITPTITFTGGMRANHLTISVDGTPVVDDDFEIGANLARVVDTRTLSNGSHSFRVSFTDESGAVWSLTKVATVANAPKAAFTWPTSASGSWTITPTVTVPPGSTVAKLQLLEGTTVRAEDTAAPWSVTWDTATVGDASRSLTLRIVDTAGRASTSAATVATWNRPRPVMGTTAATVKGTVNIPITLTLPPTMATATAVAIQVFTSTGTTPVATVAATGSGTSWSAAWDTGTLPDGAYRIKAAATGDNGLVGTGAGSGRAVTLANPPVVTGNPFFGVGVVTFSPTATSPVGTALVKAELFKNGVLVATDTTQPWSLAWNYTAAPSGSYTLVVKVTDALGRVGKASAVGISKG